MKNIKKRSVSVDLCWPVLPVIKSMDRARLIINNFTRCNSPSSFLSSVKIPVLRSRHTLDSKWEAWKRIQCVGGPSVWPSTRFSLHCFRNMSPSIPPLKCGPIWMCRPCVFDFIYTCPLVIRSVNYWKRFLVITFQSDNLNWLQPWLSQPYMQSFKP